MSNDIGEVNWNEVSVGGFTKTDFLKLNEGMNKVRIMSNPVQYYVHWVTNSDGKRRKFNSPEDPALVQKLEDLGFKRQRSFLIRVLDRKDSAFKLLEVGPQTISGIRSLVENSDWGDIRKYDVAIIKRKNENPVYTVQGIPPTPLADSFKAAFKEFNENLDIARLIAPTEPKYIYEFFGWSADGEDNGVDASEVFGGTSDDMDYDFG